MTGLLDNLTCRPFGMMEIQLTVTRRENKMVVRYI
jgi:hypothetical protein